MSDKKFAVVPLSSMNPKDFNEKVNEGMKFVKETSDFINQIAREKGSERLIRTIPVAPVEAEDSVGGVEKAKV